MYTSAMKSFGFGNFNKKVGLYFIRKNPKLFSDIRLIMYSKIMGAKKTLKRSFEYQLAYYNF